MFSIFRLREYLESFLYFGIKSGGGGGGTQTVTEKSEPWKGVQDDMNFIYNQGRDIYRNDQADYYPNDTFLPYSPQTMSGLQGQLNYAGGMGGALANATASDSAYTLSGGYLQGNPYLNDIVGDVTSDVMNSVNSTFSKGGRFGGAAHADTLADSVGGAAAQLRGQNYQNERENMARYQALAPQSFQTGMMPYQTAVGVGGDLEAKEYEALNADMNRWNYNENQRYNELAKYNNLLSGGMNFAETTGTQPVYGGSRLQSGIGGGLAGYGLASNGMLGPVTGPWGAVGGAVLGGLFT